jgi:CDP-diacylglycerol--serine O-phosphatidyltransferase
MANRYSRQIPNLLTCGNLFSGCIAAVAGLQGDYPLALAFIVLGATFDFFDGMTARLLKVSGPLGKELDSLADDITFGFAPAAIVFSLMQQAAYPAWLAAYSEYIPYTAFLIAVFSALRLGKFNIDPRQSSSFIGLPTPANALFWAALAAGSRDFLLSDACSVVYLLALVIVMSLMLVAEIPMFSLKFKHLSWRDNRVSYLFLIVCIPMFPIFKISAFAAIIVWYILLSLVTGRKK